jgi:tetratricopeptide (TPR) repeat protein
VGEAELRLKHYPAALSAFETAAASPAQDPALRFRALAGSGLAHEEQRRWAQAKRFYDEVAAQSVDRELAAWAVKRRAAVAARLEPPRKAGEARAPERKKPEAARPEPARPETRRGAGGKP